jgi:hypothetical protein
MSKKEESNLRVTCLLKEYEETAECFRHTYATIWQSGIMFATFSVAVFGFFFSFEDKLKLYLPYLPFVSLGSILVWWLMVFEPMNHYGDIRQERCSKIEEELSSIVPNLNMRHFREYGAAKGFLRVRLGVRILAVIIIIVMLLLALAFAFPSGLPLDP